MATTLKEIKSGAVLTPLEASILTKASELPKKPDSKASPDEKMAYRAFFLAPSGIRQAEYGKMATSAIATSIEAIVRLLVALSKTSEDGKRATGLKLTHSVKPEFGNRPGHSRQGLTTSSVILTGVTLQRVSPGTEIQVTRGNLKALLAEAISLSKKMHKFYTARPYTERQVVAKTAVAVQPGTPLSNFLTAYGINASSSRKSSELFNELRKNMSTRGYTHYLRYERRDPKTGVAKTVVHKNFINAEQDPALMAVLQSQAVNMYTHNADSWSKSSVKLVPAQGGMTILAAMQQYAQRIVGPEAVATLAKKKGFLRPSLVAKFYSENPALFGFNPADQAVSPDVARAFQMATGGDIAALWSPTMAELSGENSVVYENDLRSKAMLAYLLAAYAGNSNVDAMSIFRLRTVINLGAVRMAV